MTATKWGNKKDANGFELLNLVLQHILGDHSSSATGLVWYDSQNDVFKGNKSGGPAVFGEAGAGGDADTLDGHDTSYFLARGNHTGTQTASTISDFASAVAANIPSSYATDAEVASAVSTAISNLIGGAGAAYDTLVEIQALLEGDAASIGTLTTAIGHRARGLPFTIGDGTSLTYNCDHNFGHKDVICQAYVISSGATIEPDFDRTTNNRVVVSYGTGAAPATNAHRVLISEIPG